MGAILIYSEKDDLARELLTAAREIAGKTGRTVKAVTLNNNSQAEVLCSAGAEVYRINHENLALIDCGGLSEALKQAAEKLDADMVLLSSNRRGKELAGRLAGVMGAGCLTDISGLSINNGLVECQRNALGGATVAVQYVEGKQVLAIRPKVFEAAANGAGSLSDISVEVSASKIKLLEFKLKDGEQVDIENAALLVAVGQGLDSEESLAAVNTLAASLGAEVACSKPLATDKKWLPEDRIIGLSGKKCTPDLALLFGISGQVQFTVGIRDARIIAAVNTDENAAINYMADYIMQADLHEVIAEMNRILA